MTIDRLSEKQDFVLCRQRIQRRAVLHCKRVRICIGTVSANGSSTAPGFAPTRPTPTKKPPELKQTLATNETNRRYVGYSSELNDTVTCTQLRAGQDVDKWLDIKKVNGSILINICFALKPLSGKNINKWLDIKKVDDTIHVDISKNASDHATQ